LKADQNVSYLKDFLKDMNKESDAKFSGPALFAVLTIRTVSGLVDASFRSAHLGVFLCVPATGSSSTCTDFRMALIWRDVFHTLPDASKGMGMTLRAASALAGIVADPESVDYASFRYLGPNCCRMNDKVRTNRRTHQSKREDLVQSIMQRRVFLNLPPSTFQVLRAYDTRFRPTSRRPDLYGDPEIAPGTQVVCRISDKNLAVAAAATAGAAAEAGIEASGQDGPELSLRLRDCRPKVDDSIAKQDWLWEFGGELLVIETVFHEGPQYAPSPKEFIPVVAFLQKMHEKGYVHGDIRCANIVFGKCLIDFDLGGRLEDAPTYPAGYQSSLVDGSRLGTAGALITKWHDWHALLKVMFELHQLYPPADDGTVIDRDRDRDYFVRKTGKPITPLAGDSLGDEAKVQNLADELITFLHQAESWTVLLTDEFHTAVTSWGGFAEPTPRRDSDPATGSPQDPKR
jgi:hypothetical protein